MKVELVRVTEEPLSTIEKVACNCYDSTPTEDYRIAQSCYNSGHLSVFEFAQFHFHIEGVSRALLAQITRHRTGKFCVRSQRYTDEDEFHYVIPKTISNDIDAMHYYEGIMMEIMDAYTRLKELGIPKEDARMVLPNACETVLDFSVDFRNLMHFFNERLCTNAQWEIRELAQEMKSLIIAKYPELEEYCVPKCETHEIAFCTEKKSCGKHKRLKDIIKE